MSQKTVSREQYSELVLLLLEQASFPGAEAENVVALKQLTIELAERDPWAPEPPTLTELAASEPVMPMKDARQDAE